MIWTNELTLQFVSLTHHTSPPQPYHTPYTTQQVTPSRFELGRDVTKVFDGKLFRGHIECIDSNDDDGGLMYTVVYEDGDKEDLDSQECEVVVVVTLTDYSDDKEWEG